MAVATISLNNILETFPISWRMAYAPNPCTSYISSTFNDLVAQDIITPQDKYFWGFSSVARYFSPLADELGLIFFEEVICWYFYFDDPFDWGEISHSEADRLIERMLDILHCGQLPANPSPSERLCASFWKRAYDRAAGRTDAFKRFTLACMDWVKSILPIDRRRSQTVATLQDYNALRLANVGIIPMYAINEINLGLSLKTSFVSLPDVIRLGELTALIVAYCNDIYSYELEVEKATQLNSLEIRTLENQLTLEEAYYEHIDAIREYINEFINIEKSLIERELLEVSELATDPEAAQCRQEQTSYIDAMRSIILGNHFWSLDDGRYHSVNSPFLELKI